jgi:nitrilase
VSPEGKYLAEPLTEGEGMVVAELDFSLIAKRKRMMDSVGHYARPELLSLAIDSRPARTLMPMPGTDFPTDRTDAHDPEPVSRRPPADDGAAVARTAAA